MVLLINDVVEILFDHKFLRVLTIAWHKKGNRSPLHSTLYPTTYESASTAQTKSATGAELVGNSSATFYFLLE